MADPDTDKTRQAADKTPNAEAPRQDAEGLQGQANPMLDTASRVSQEAMRRTSEGSAMARRTAASR